MAIQRLETNARMSHIVLHEGTVYLAGAVAQNFDQGIEAQTREAWLPAGAAPARATCQARMAAPDILVELIVTAALSEH